MCCVYLSVCTEYLKTARVGGGCVSQALSVSHKTCGGMLQQNGAGIDISKMAFVHTIMGRWARGDPARWKVHVVLHRVDSHCVRRQLHPCSLLAWYWYVTFSFFHPHPPYKRCFGTSRCTFVVLFFFSFFLTTEMYLCGVILRRRELHHVIGSCTFSLFFFFCDVYSLYLFWQKQQLWTVGRKRVFLMLFFFVCVCVALCISICAV